DTYPPPSRALVSFGRAINVDLDYHSPSFYSQTFCSILFSQSAITSPCQALGLQKHPSLLPFSASTRRLYSESFSLLSVKYFWNCGTTSARLVPFPIRNGLPKYPSRSTGAANISIKLFLVDVHDHCLHR